ncbi:Uncharacterised protein [Rodentibacter pneumotropicus]|uniref:Uncharacterized protein n=1 Tax=Rodentibacter pneumotropicus TaxID=758 RepID=A0A3S5ESA1_9PAST|nr:Uncharacterised protein [Rodentibacter pneumotropicus]
MLFLTLAVFALILVLLGYLYKKTRNWDKPFLLV